MAQQKRNQVVETGNHILAVYQDMEVELEEAFEFLIYGLERNEAVMLITDDKSKDEIRKQISIKWNVDANALEQNGSLVIRTTPEFYFPYEPPSTHKLNTMWVSMLDYMRVRRKDGMRLFTDMSAFFRYGFVKELVLYESTLEKKFDFPFTAVCAYKSKDIDTLTQRQQKMLKEHHDVMWE